MNRSTTKTRKIFALLILVVMVLTTGIPGVSYAQSSPMSDIEGHWAYKDISSWINQGLISGYPDGNFRPNGEISRAEFFALVNRAFKLGETAAIAYTDVKSGDWFYSEIAKAKKAGYISGNGDGTVRPNAKITRQEVAVIIAKLKALPENAEAAAAFTDSSSFASWSKGFIGAVAKAKIMSGNTDGSFGAAKNITRAEAVVTLNRALAQEIKIDVIADQKVDVGTLNIVTGIKTTPADAVVSVKSSDEKIVTAAAKSGCIELKGIAVGNAEITVTAKKDGYKDGTLKFKVSVQTPVSTSSSYTPSEPTVTPPPTTPTPTPTPVNNKPVIKVEEPDGVNDGIITLTLGSAFVAPKVTASDAEDGNVTAGIVKTGEDKVDISKAGDYVLTYNVKDSKGLAAVECRVTVRVVGTIAATANISVKVQKDMPNFKQITVNSATAGVRFKVEGSSLTSLFGNPVTVSTNEASRIVYIIDIAGNVVGVVPVDVSKDSDNAVYNFNSLIISKINAIANIGVTVAADLPNFKEIKVNSSTVGVKYSVAGSELVKSFGEVIVVSTTEATKAVSLLDVEGNVLAVINVDVSKPAVKDYTFSFPRIENALVTIKVDVAQDLSSFKQITAVFATAGACYKVEGSALEKAFGEAITVNTNEASRIVSILDATKGVLGTVTVDVTKNSEKDYTFKDIKNPPPAQNSKPVISVVEPDGVNDGIITLTAGTAFRAPTVTASDAEDGDITNRIVRLGEDKVDISKPGEYVLTYNVTDLKGLAADECKVTVKVIPGGTVTKSAVVTLEVAKDLPTFKSIKVVSSTVGVKFKVEGSTLVKAFGEVIIVNTSSATRVVTFLDAGDKAVGTATVNVGSGFENQAVTIQ